jgi:hypothetical protein
MSGDWQGNGDENINLIIEREGDVFKVPSFTKQSNKHTVTVVNEQCAGECTLICGYKKCAICLCMMSCTCYQGQWRSNQVACKHKHLIRLVYGVCGAQGPEKRTNVLQPVNREQSIEQPIEPPPVNQPTLEQVQWSNRCKQMCEAMRKLTQKLSGGCDDSEDVRQSAEKFESAMHELDTRVSSSRPTMFEPLSAPNTANNVKQLRFNMKEHKKGDVGRKRRIAAESQHMEVREKYSYIFYREIANLRICINLHNREIFDRRYFDCLTVQFRLVK